jgi:hypothetical protein
LKRKAIKPKRFHTRDATPLLLMMLKEMMLVTLFGAAITDIRDGMTTVRDTGKKTTRISRKESRSQVNLSALKE